MWVLSGFSSFLQTPKNLPLSGLPSLNYPLHVNDCVNMNIVLTRGMFRHFVRYSSSTMTLTKIKWLLHGFLLLPASSMIFRHQKEHIFSDVPGTGTQTGFGRFWIWTNIPTLLFHTTMPGRKTYLQACLRFSYGSCHIQSETEDGHIMAVLSDTLLISFEFFANVHE